MNNKKKFRIEVADIWGLILTFISIIFALVTSWFKKTDLTGAIIAVSYQPWPQAVLQEA